MQGHDKSTAKKHLMVFSLAAPVAAFFSYFGLTRVRGLGTSQGMNDSVIFCHKNVVVAVSSLFCVCVCVCVCVCEVECVCVCEGEWVYGKPLRGEGMADFSII